MNEDPKNHIKKDTLDKNNQLVKRQYRPPIIHELTSDELNEHVKFLKLIKDPIWHHKEK